MCVSSPCSVRALALAPRRQRYGHDLTPIGRRSRRNKLSKLQECDLIEHEGPAQNRVYRALDEDIKPPIDAPGINQHAAE